MEKQVYEKIAAVLGKELDDAVVLNLFEVLDDKPESVIDNEHMTSSFLRNSGLHLSFSKLDNFYCSVFFHYGSAMAESGNIAKYRGDLLAGIEFGDSRDQVEKKLGLKPVSSQYIPGCTADDSKDLWEEYDLDRHKLRFMFHAPEFKLGSMSVSQRGSILLGE